MSLKTEHAISSKGIPQRRFLKLRLLTNLGEGHLGNDGEHDLLALGRVRVLPMLEEPGLERRSRLPGRILPPCGSPVQVHRTAGREATGRTEPASRGRQCL